MHLVMSSLNDASYTPWLSVTVCTVTPVKPFLCNVLAMTSFCDVYGVNTAIWACDILFTL